MRRSKARRGISHLLGIAIGLVIAVIIIAPIVYQLMFAGHHMGKTPILHTRGGSLSYSVVNGTVTINVKFYAKNIGKENAVIYSGILTLDDNSTITLNPSGGSPITIGPGQGAEVVLTYSTTDTTILDNLKNTDYNVVVDVNDIPQTVPVSNINAIS